MAKKQDKEIRTIKDIPEKNYLIGGSATCAGCGPELGLKMALKGIGDDAIVVNPAGCMTLLCNYPHTPLRVSWIHNAIENAASTSVGIVHALKARKRKGTVICYAGDGATYDIGFGSLAYAAYLNEPIVYVCYNNECYGNTGNQWDSSTPKYAATSTTPRTMGGNPATRKDMVKIMNDHGVYATTVSLAQPVDYINKVKKVKESGEFGYIELLGACPTNWHFPPNKTIEISQLALDTGFWPLYERTKDGKVIINYKPKKLKPVIDFLKMQGRFSHLTEKQIQTIQELVIQRWDSLLKEAGEE